jgi:excisionase family DNA binding protein
MLNRAGSVSGRDETGEMTVSLTNISDRERLAYTINDFGRMIGLGRSTIYAMIAKGEIQVSQVGCRKLISHSDAVALLERSKVKRTDAADASAAG